VKGDESFAERVLRDAKEPRILRRGLTVEKVAREVARRLEVGLAEMGSPGRGRAASEARTLTAWVGREAGNLSIARTAKYFERDTSTMTRNVARLETRMRQEKEMRRVGREILEELSAF
jgi:chromosomal replication initiation ATPase DnaA